MTDETQSGVLLKGADGSHYFIPATDLSRTQWATFRKTPATKSRERRHAWTRSRSTLPASTRTRHRSSCPEVESGPGGSGRAGS